MKPSVRLPAALLACALAAAAGWGAERAGTARPSKDDAYRSDRAVIVVTGMRLNEDPADYRMDLKVGEGATVRLIAKDGTVREKKTAPFAGGRRPDGTGHFTADFAVDLDASYTIEMAFADGTVVRIADYRLPREWKTHFYFHGTTGTLSPSSVLRFAEDARTRLRCCAYAVYPPETYRTLGGRQEP